MWAVASRLPEVVLLLLFRCHGCSGHCSCCLSRGCRPLARTHVCVGGERGRGVGGGRPCVVQGCEPDVRCTPSHGGERCRAGGGAERTHRVEGLAFRFPDPMRGNNCRTMRRLGLFTCGEFAHGGIRLERA